MEIKTYAWQIQTRRNGLWSQMPGVGTSVDVLPAVNDGDSSCAAHAALRRVPASTPTATASSGLTSAPQAFELSARPAANTFTAAL